ncbi:MAG: SAM-dependent chlorinase/fluorinase [Anaerosomatales bacterium]|nr:SAM-dependent chlorinase/fluorinase [Anaerosomatales bacterium]
MQSIICFTSDFGMGDTWVGICHAVIYKACPQARVVDLAHDVPPYDIRKAAAVAAAGVWQLPDAIHLVVVDPGVGGPRKDLCLVTAGGTVLVGPDNGVLLPASWRSGGVSEAYAIQPEVLKFEGPLATFHARDVLAPAAAALACGIEPAALGERIDAGRLAPPPFSQARREGDVFVAESVDIDRFGSVRISVSSDDLRSERVPDRVEMAFGHTVMEVPFRRTFSDVGEGEPVALVDSSGWLTLAVFKGSAADRYGIEPGTPFRVRLL